MNAFQWSTQPRLADKSLSTSSTDSFVNAVWVLKSYGSTGQKACVETVGTGAARVSYLDEGFRAQADDAAINRYEVRLTLLSGTEPSSNFPLGVWAPLEGNEQLIQIFTSSVGSVSCVVRAEIRDAQTLGVVATARITLTATKTA